MAVDEPKKDKTSVDDSDLVESGKKDPFVRRQELLINSGLAEVGCFSFPSNNLIIPSMFHFFHTDVCLFPFLNLLFPIKLF